ncbi:hypothetical protein GCM10025859_06220 [Alicyclobacillus fastidiosus]|nr:hypothetical protein GCM10025859_06220 [Alicyclobacillus fastidiosus]
MVLDTDTYNEIDDQFALVWALRSQQKVTVEAIYAAPFFNHLSSDPKDGMEKSYDEIRRILSILHIPSDGYVFKGSKGYLKNCHTPQYSEAAQDLVQRAMNTDADPLYVVSIGAITNVASAILMEPRIINKIVVVWLGGHAHHWPDTAEFNLKQDVAAARIIFDSGVPLVQIPCAGVASHLLTTLSEMRDYVKGQGEIGDYLYETFKNCQNDHFGYSRVIWDMTTMAYLINPSWVSTSLVHSPILTDQLAFSQDTSRHFIRYATSVNRDAIFRDFFLKIKDLYAPG